MLGGLIAAAAFCRRSVARLGTLMGYVAGWGFILCAAFITFDVIARRFFGFSSQATTELTGYALVDESLLFGATDISLLRTPLWLPQGLWGFGIVVFLALIVLMLVENALLLVAGRGAEVEAQLHTRTYDEEAAEALEAVGAKTRIEAP